MAWRSRHAPGASGGIVPLARHGLVAKMQYRREYPVPSTDLTSGLHDRRSRIDIVVKHGDPDPHHVTRQSEFGHDFLAAGMGTLPPIHDRTSRLKSVPNKRPPLSVGFPLQSSSRTFPKTPAVRRGQRQTNAKSAVDAPPRVSRHIKGDCSFSAKDHRPSFIQDAQSACVHVPQMSQGCRTSCIQA